MWVEHYLLIASNPRRRFDSGDPGGAATRNSGMQELTVGLHTVKDRTKGIIKGGSPHSGVIHLFPAQHRQTCRPCESGARRAIDRQKISPKFAGDADSFAPQFGTRESTRDGPAKVCESGSSPLVSWFDSGGRKVQYHLPPHLLP